VRLHAPEYAPRRGSAHDCNCSGGPRSGQLVRFAGCVRKMGRAVEGCTLVATYVECD
jgi:hypothetical protein